MLLSTLVKPLEGSPDAALLNGTHNGVLHVAQAQQLNDVIHHVAEVSAPLRRHAAQLGAVRQVLAHRQVLVHDVILAPYLPQNISFLSQMISSLHFRLHADLRLRELCDCFYVLQY